MIKKNELRIGNYVMDIVSGEWMIVDELAENVGAVLINRDKYPLADGWRMDYIPLTPEILERCGFEKKNEDGVETFTFQIKGIADHGDNEYKLFGIKSKALIQIDYTVNNYWAAKPVFYLHQLQNLYQSLTGIELEIKELQNA